MEPLAVNPASYDDFEAALSAELQKRTGAGSSFGAELMPLVIQLLQSALTSCLGQTTPATVAQRATEPTNWDRRMMEFAVRQQMYDGSVRKYRQDKGYDIAAAVFDACETVGPVAVASLVTGAKPDLDWVM
jgi:hypothetical protein